MSRFDDVETGDPGDQHVESPEGKPAPMFSYDVNDVKTVVVIANQTNDHPAHPESLSPRVFYTVRELARSFTRLGAVIKVRHYEILQTGYAIPWKTLPKTFEYLHFTLDSEHCVNLVREGAAKFEGQYWAGTDKTIFEEVG